VAFQQISTDDAIGESSLKNGGFPWIASHYFHEVTNVINHAAFMEIYS
jgi:hypothetical protein